MLHESNNQHLFVAQQTPERAGFSLQLNVCANDDDPGLGGRPCDILYVQNIRLCLSLNRVPLGALSMRDRTDDKDQFITTKSGNKISRQCVLVGKEKIALPSGKVQCSILCPALKRPNPCAQSIIEAKVVLRGDLGVITVGQYCVIGENTVVRCPDQRFKG